MLRLAIRGVAGRRRRRAAGLLPLRGLHRETTGVLTAGIAAVLRGVAGLLRLSLLVGLTTVLLRLVLLPVVLRRAAVLAVLRLRVELRLGRRRSEDAGVEQKRGDTGTGLDQRENKENPDRPIGVATRSYREGDGQQQPEGGQHCRRRDTA